MAATINRIQNHISIIVGAAVADDSYRGMIALINVRQYLNVR